MPFINGRYYVNPIMGEALEAAREAEAALAALENRARQNSGASAGGDDAEDDQFGNESNCPTAGSQKSVASPIHRVEIEAAELVPAHSGRAARGYVARVHRQGARGASGFASRSPEGPGPAETHVFADHRDLVSFLRDEFAKDRNDAETHGRSA